MKIKCLLVDDEPPAQAVLQSHIASLPMLQLVGQCHNAIAALEELQRQPIDLMFLDIKMPQLLGTHFLRTLRHPPKVIFTTAYPEYALEAFDLDVVDYLLKPISFERFLRAIQKIQQPELSGATTSAPHTQHASSERFLYFRVDRKMVKVMVSDILYIESLKDYVRIVTTSKQIVPKQTISSLEEMLPEESFARIHRSYIVALDKVDSFSPCHVEVMGKELPVGRNYRQEMEKTIRVRGI
ncbi:LytR/AlgR family response regulator transcription factor [Rufibacter latericius]|uniref:DNA-binding response regulator n=1 Tax=Rufibacter latericius TaxID=2487040 RepID=A0A3M9MVF2_9BACT|nr:LytTR family DNA-binding domain-containing protein [Rufibacter latericius]RNI29165.1 DNA-binding response regulator [Rufibacter latericius]